MPHNAATGKADRRPLSVEVVRKFRIERVAARRKGKGRARDSPDASEQAPSPSAHLVGLKKLFLDSGSSLATTPVDSPATPATHPPRPPPCPN